MGSEDDYEFGPDTAAIRMWLEKRASYAGGADPGGAHPGGKHRRPPSEASQTPLPSGTSAARSVLAALGTTPAEADQQPEAPAAPDHPVDAAPALPTYPPAPLPRKVERYRPDRERYAELEPAPVGQSTSKVFKPRTGVRTALAMVLLVALAATAAAGWYAYREQTTTAIGVAAILGVLTLVVWAVRAGAAPTEIAVLNGQLELVRGGKFEAIDLASPFTPVLVEGEPGRRGWKVLIERLDQPLLVIDRSLVDPHEFTEILYRLRPDVSPDAPSRSA